MSNTAEAEVNPDGSTTFEEQPPPSTADDPSEGMGDAGANATGEDDGNSTFFNATGDAEGMMDEGEKRTDPAIYLGIAIVVIGVCLLLYALYRRRKNRSSDFEFFTTIDGDKFNLKLPAAVEEYYVAKDKCIDQGWEPGQAPKSQAAAASGPHRVLAQALMKRCIADIPLVQHIQKEANGMNKLYAQSMCSVKQWRAFQNAETLVSAEVDAVRAEADEIEPGWSQVIWRQAMQYHQMLKQKHEMEAKQMAAQMEKKRKEDAKVEAAKKKVDDEQARVIAAEKAAQELIQAEEREKASKKAFKNGGMKKGFLTNANKKK